MKHIEKLNEDLKKTAEDMTANEARYLVDAYYTVQEYRKATGNQVRALSKQGEPNELISWFHSQHCTLENNIKRALDIYTDQHPVGAWAKSIIGVGPVISAGLLAHIDITKAPTAGNIWSFAGLDPGVRWLGREKAAELTNSIVGNEKPTYEHVVKAANVIGRKPENLYKDCITEKGNITKENIKKGAAKCPYNQKLKTLCWKIGESFVKKSGKPDSLYGRLYSERKEKEIAANERLEYKEQAEKKLENYNIGTDTDAYQYYIIGKLPPGHIHSRAKRRTVKFFLSHFHHVYYEYHYGEQPPNPFTIEHLGHTDYIAPPGREGSD